MSHSVQGASSIPVPPPPPPFSLLPPAATVSVRPTFNYANVDSLDDSSDEDGEGGEGDEELENTTAVTRYELSPVSYFSLTNRCASFPCNFFVHRFLIKHLPKQLSKLRNDKADLEDKIENLEQRIGQQSVALQEMERRNQNYRKEIDKVKTSSRVHVPMLITEVGTEVVWIFSSAPSVSILNNLFLAIRIFQE